MSMDPKEWERFWPDHLKRTNSDDVDYDDSMSAIAEREKLLASEHPVTPVLAAVGSLEHECQKRLWGKPQSVEDAFSERYSKSKIVDIDFSDNDPSIFALMAKEIAEKIQFPINTAYLHGIGVFSSALVVNFQIEFYNGHMPPGMYTVCAQPTGASKSPVNDIFAEPISKALDKRSRILSAFHKLNQMTIEKATEKSKKCESEIDLRMLFEEIHKSQDELTRKPPVKSPMKNVTPEAAEDIARQQYGVINIISDESEALDSAIGGMYQADGKSAKTNNGVFLAAFDGGRMAVGRISRNGMEGSVRGAFCVMAQDGAVKTIIEKGSEGRGVTERCLILRERTLQGRRKWKSFRENSLDKNLLADYAKLCEEVLTGEYPLTVRVSDEIMNMLIDMKNQVEPLLLPGNKYSGEQIKGAVSKLDKQILKMAAALHIAYYWSGKSGTSKYLELESRFVSKAMCICIDLLDSYTTLVEAFGEDSSSKQAADVFRVVQNASKAGKLYITFDNLRQNVKNMKWYKTLDNKAEYLLNLLRRFEELNVCALKELGSNKKLWAILINPAMAMFVPKEEE